MDMAQALEMIKPLSDGINPLTGEEFPIDSPYQHPQIVRALCLAIAVLEKEMVRTRRQEILPGSAGRPWSAEEDEELVKEFESGKSIKDLSESHQRTKGAIHSRLIKLGRIKPVP